MIDDSRPIPMISLSSNMQPDNYLVKSQNEIASIIYTLCKKQIPVTVYSGKNKKNYTFSQIASIRPAHGILGLALRDGDNKKDLFSNSITCVANHNMAHIQFELSKISSTDKIYMAALPKKLFRLQRRKDERLSIPQNYPATCKIILGNGNAVVLELIDISTGGVKLIDFESRINPVSDMFFEKCQIDLGDTNIIDVDLLIKNSSEISLSDGKKAVIINCAFKEASVKIFSIIQNFIHGMELTFRKKLNL